MFENFQNLFLRRSHGTESVQGSLSSLNSEFDDTVWQINEEQREYYTNQFMNLHPENGFVKGNCSSPKK